MLRIGSRSYDPSFVDRPSNAASSSTIRFHLDDLRRRLLDISNTNNLINFRHTDRSRRQIRIIDEVPDFLFGRLVSGRVFGFKPLLQSKADLAAVPPPSLVELARKANLDPSFELPCIVGEDAPAKHTDDFLQTLLLPDDLEKKLIGLQDAYRSSLDEQGVPALWGAFGFLEWRERDDADAMMLSPLLLVPLDIERKATPKGVEFTIVSNGEDAEINQCLAARLKRDFGFVLPLLDEMSPEHYFQKIESLIVERDGWGVRRYVTATIASFARIAMYEDLDEARWPAYASPVDHPVLASLLGGRDEASANEGPELEDDTLLDTVPLIDKADSSQTRAILDALSGRNLVIKGPPGTGKSQTITNLIGAALDQGKSVLFVAEKLAALEVVANRLQHAGLGEFCLELHSSKATKRYVLESLKRRLELNPEVYPPQLPERLAEMLQLRERLDTYLRDVSTPFGATRLPVHEILWRLRKSEDSLTHPPDALFRVLLPDVERWTEADLEAARAVLRQTETALRNAATSDGTPHAWAWLGRHAPAAAVERQFVQDLRTAQRQLNDIQSRLAENKLGASLSAGRVSALESLVEQLTSIEVPDVPVAMLQALGAPESPAQLERLELQRQSLLSLEREARTFCSDPRRALTDIAANDAARRAVAVLGPSDLKLRDLPTAITNHRRLQQTLREAIRHWRVIDDAAPSLGDISDLLKLAVIVGSAGRDVLTSRSEALMTDEATALLRVWDERGSQIRKQKHTLSTRITAETFPPSTELRGHALVLRSSGLFSCLTSKFRAARSTYRFLTAGRKESPRQMVADFESAAAIAEFNDAAQASTELREVAGAMFKGPNTDFALLLRVNEWGCQIRSALVGLGARQRLRQYAFTCHVDALDALAHDLGHSAGATLLADLLLNANPSSIAALTELLEKRIESMQRLLDVRAKSLEPDMRLADLSRVADIAAQYQAATALFETEFKKLAPTMNVPEIDSLVFGRVRDLSVQLSGLADQTRELWCHAAAGGTLPAVTAWLASVQLSLSELAKTRGLSEKYENVSFHGLFDNRSIDEVSSAALRSVNAADSLATWRELQTTLANAERAGFQWLLDAYRGEDRPLQSLDIAFDAVFYRTLVAQAFKQLASLEKFTGLSLEEAKRRYQDLEDEIVTLRRRAIAAKLRVRHVEPGVAVGSAKDKTELALVRHEAEKERRHLPLRDLFRRAPQAVRALKPCFLMSPLSVAQLLPPDMRKFDLVIMDEASQVRPEDAICALLRGNQLVVVGDPQQLPPTSFFARYVVDNDDTDDDQDERVANESILDLASTTFHPARDLRWHYRSRHHQLIQFSNARFYDSRLNVFPSSRMPGATHGVHIDWVKDPDYQGSVNVPEAEQIAEAVLSFARVHPKSSLGVVTMNQAQRDEIREQIDLKAQHDPTFREYEASWQDGLHPFFVKNLENVQGDERDVIFVSVTYGPSKGAESVHQRFGPLNSAAGPRRLNVLFTRAKDSIRVFSSMKPAQIVNEGEGAQVLRAYLEFASSGILAPTVQTGRSFDSAFEECVAARLKAAGFDVVPQVGVNGFFIDLGIRHPSYPLGFVCGVECDGALYHSSRIAKDRDKIREEILKGLGWDLVRVWSTDWFRDPHGETKKLVARIEGILVSKRTE